MSNTKESKQLVTVSSKDAKKLSLYIDTELKKLSATSKRKKKSNSKR